MEINLEHKSCLMMYDLGNLGQSRSHLLGWLTTRAAQAKGAEQKEGRWLRQDFYRADGQHRAAQARIFGLPAIV